MDNANPVKGDGLVSSYSFEQNNAITTFDTNNIIDGIIEEGGRFDGTNDEITIADDSSLNFGTEDFSVSSWVIIPDSMDSIGTIVGKRKTVGANQFHLRVTSNKLSFLVYGGASDNAIGTSDINDSTWHHVVGVRNTTNLLIYVDGVLDGTPVANTGQDISSVGDDMTIGRHTNNVQPFNGSLDDIRIYNRSLTTDEINILYNSGSGTESISSGAITLNAPANNNISYSGSVTYNCSVNVTGGATINNVSLWTNETGVWAIRNTTDMLVRTDLPHNTALATDGTQAGYTGIAINVSGIDIVLNSFNKDPASGVSGTGKVGTTPLGSEVATCTWVGDTCTPASPVTLSANTNYFITGAGGDFKWTTNPATTNYSQFDYWGRVDQEGGIIEGQLATIASLNIDVYNTTNIIETFNRTITASTLWTCQVCDSDGDCGFALENRTVLIDLIAPTINITYPDGTVDYGAIGENETLNWTATDDNIDTCWYEYNNTNTTVTCSENTTSFILVDDFTNVTFYANDSIGNEVSSFLDWTYNLTANSQTYPSTSVESATETYIANLTYNSSAFNIISGVVTINGTEYTGTRTGTGDSAILTASVIMPSIATETNFTTYWTIDLTDVGGTIDYNLTSHNVTVGIVNFSLCGAIINYSLLEFYSIE